MRTKRLVTLAIAFIALEAVDAGVTLWATNHGYAEGNPLLASFAHTWAQPVVKMVVALLVVWLLSALWRRPNGQRAASIGFAAIIVLQAGALVTWGLTFAAQML